MNKYKSFLIALGMLCALLVVVSFMIAGTPVSQQAVNLDQIRLNNFNEIKSSVDDYYRKNLRIPETLDELQSIQQSIKTQFTDPESDTKYTYKQLTATTFELCTTFSTDSSQTDTDIYAPFETDTSHIKGYDCITYSISAYLLTPSPRP